MQLFKKQERQRSTDNDHCKDDRKERVVYGNRASWHGSAPMQNNMQLQWHDSESGVKRTMSGCKERAATSLTVMEMPL